jgi:hypothetical protein
MKIDGFLINDSYWQNIFSQKKCQSSTTNHYKQLNYFLCIWHTLIQTLEKGSCNLSIKDRGQMKSSSPCLMSDERKFFLSESQATLLLLCQERMRRIY